MPDKLTARYRIYPTPSSRKVLLVRQEIAHLDRAETDREVLRGRATVERGDPEDRCAEPGGLAIKEKTTAAGHGL
ncbi:hypothetical protein [Curtobacterium sp. S6]|uniref:hypothetical protein n=1 Tax=Curtobacterium sp. S6 TaxID=1479623 RepID=UPI0004AB2F48|nr:hypothetical protein [Curtobacterium sp. S6]